MIKEKRKGKISHPVIVKKVKRENTQTSHKKILVEDR